jgi:hypothetical protein
MFQRSLLLLELRLFLVYPQNRVAGCSVLLNGKVNLIAGMLLVAIDYLYTCSLLALAHGAIPLIHNHILRFNY